MPQGTKQKKDERVKLKLCWNLLVMFFFGGGRVGVIKM